MAITYFVQVAGTYVAFGLAADTKPVSPPNDSMFIETDTALTYVSIANAWVVKTTGANLVLSDVTTNDANTSRHGFMPKATGSTTTFYRSDGTQATPTATAADPDISPASSRTIATNKTVVQGRVYQITGVLNLTLQGTATLTII